jgi:pimeloyl-ACP methyl ester carboxylesterase
VIRTHDWGGSGAVVLLAHATGFHGRVWAPVAERLVAAGRRVWSFDFRGHGDSDPSESYAWQGFADDALAVTAQLGLAGDPDLVAAGHSKGGAALLLGEAREPGTYAHIWAYEPIIFPPYSETAPEANNLLSETARRRRSEWPSLDAAYDRYASRPPLNVMTPEALRAYVDYGLRDCGDGTFVLKCTPEVEARVYEMATQNGAWDVLPRVQTPVVIACGEASHSVGPELATQLVDRLPHARLEVFAGLGHFGPMQDPAAIAASILCPFTSSLRH